MWKVPEGFSLHTDAEEPADVSPVLKLSGHLRFVSFHPCYRNKSNPRPERSDTSYSIPLPTTSLPAHLATTP